MLETGYWFYIGISFLSGVIICVLGYIIWRRFYRPRRANEFYEALLPVLNKLENDFADTTNVDFIRSTVTKAVRVTSFQYFFNPTPPPPDDPMMRYNPGVRYKCRICRENVTATNKECCPYCGLYSAAWIESADE